MTDEDKPTMDDKVYKLSKYKWNAIFWLGFWLIIVGGCIIDKVVTAKYTPGSKSASDYILH